jgi:hypothetical protein
VSPHWTEDQLIPFIPFHAAVQEVPDPLPPLGLTYQLVACTEGAEKTNAIRTNADIKTYLKFLNENTFIDNASFTGTGCGFQGS